MKKETKLLMGTAMVALSSVALTQQAEAVATNVNINANIYAALTLNVTTHLNFGNLSHTNPAATGTATITPGAGIAVAGGVKTAGGTVSDAAVKATGQNAIAVLMTLPATDTVKTGVTGTTSKQIMVVSMDCDAAGGLQNATGCSGTLHATLGTHVFNIGGILNVKIGQTTGTYTGVVAATVNYN